MSSQNEIEAETQFSIYKVNCKYVEESFKIKHDKYNEKNLGKICDKLLNRIIQLIKKKKYEAYNRIVYNNFNGVVFKTIHNPAWRDTLQKIISNNEYTKRQSTLDEDFLTNTNVSYVLFNIYNKSLYVMTGGYGSNYISKYIERNYGLYLLPKIVQQDNPIVKRLLENNLIGNQASIQKANRNNTSILSEQDLSTIYKELNVQVNYDIAKLLGVQFNNGELKTKKVNIINKDSIVIKRRFSLSQLASVIQKLNKLESKKDNFVLNYLVPAKKKGLKNSDLTDAMIELFKEKEYKKFTLIGDDYETYYFNASSYEITMPNGQPFLKSIEFITLQDIFSEFEIKGIKFTKSFINDFIKHWCILTTDNAGVVSLYPLNIFNALQGYIEYGKDNQLCYLINGEWYVFEPIYMKTLNEEYSKIFDMKEVLSEPLKVQFNLIRKAENEDKYNKLFKNNDKAIMTHTALCNNIEIADIIFYDDNTLYLMHNKGKFDGSGTRDLTNQILTASEYLQKMLMTNKKTFLKEYYQKICEKNEVEIHPVADEDTFIGLFDKKICFIAGYLEGYKKVTSSTYAKYLTIDLDRKIGSRGQDFIPLGIY